MKVIDMLDRIAKGEKVKFKILDNDEIKDEIFEVANGSLRNRTCGKWVETKVSVDTWESISGYFLNKEVEVIEEDKKIENIGVIYFNETPTEAILHKKIEEIIEVLNERDIQRH